MILFAILQWLYGVVIGLILGGALLLLFYKWQGVL